LLCAIIAAWAVSGCSRGQHEPAGEAPPQPVPIHAATAITTTLHPSVNLVGTIVAIPERTSSVSAQIGRVVEKLAVAEGDQVHAGDLLVMLDDRQAQVDLARATALVAEKEAIVDRLKRGPLPQEIEAARQNRDKAQAALKGAEAQLAALKPLEQRSEVAPVVLENARSAVDQAQAALAAAAAQLKLLEIGTRKELIAEGEAQLALARADLETAKLAVSFCRITAPLDGVVTNLVARQGMFVERFSTLATIVDTSEVFAQVRIPSRHFGEVRLGAPAEVSLDSLPGESFAAAVTRLSGQADPATGTVDAFILVKNGNGKLRPGLACEARLSLPEIAGAVVVPTPAVADRDGTAVVTIIRDGKAYETPVKVGRQTQRQTQILEGVAAGDTVAVQGGYGLPEGFPVEIVMDNSATRSSSR
jgi:multidrug efflux pump subunit AcrA (membrane-fusion protein)